MQTKHFITRVLVFLAALVASNTTLAQPYVDNAGVNVPPAPTTIKDGPASERANSETLFLAAAKLWAGERIEDAAFLFYAGQMRARIDMRVFTPAGSGGDSPGVAVAAIRSSVGGEIEPVVMRDRDSYARVISRLSKWNPRYNADYEPGWEYKTVLPVSERAAAIKEVKEPTLKQMQALSELLRIDEYYDAFKKVQDYNLPDSNKLQYKRRGHESEAGKLQVSKEDYGVACKRIKQIEKQKGIHSGLFPDKEDLKQARRPRYKIAEEGVTYEEVIVPQADPRTFVVLSDVEYGKDSQNVYVQGHLIPGADPNTFRLLESPYARDKSNLYCGNIAMNISRIDDFEIMRTSNTWEVCFDKQSFLSEFGEPFRSVTVNQVSPAVTGPAWGRDRKNYYYGPSIVEGADYGSFKIVNDSYAEDKCREYNGRHPLEKGSIPAWVRDSAEREMLENSP